MEAIRLRKLFTEGFSPVFYQLIHHHSWIIVFIGERERANLVVQLAAIFLYIILS